MVGAFVSPAVNILLAPVLGMVEDESFEKAFLFFVAEDIATHSWLLHGHLDRMLKKTNIAVLVDVNVVGIATRGCSLGNSSDELTLQRDSGDVGNKPHHTESFPNIYVCVEDTSESTIVPACSPCLFCYMF